MENFFKDMWYGVKGLYSEHRNFILMYLFINIGVIVFMKIADIFTNKDVFVIIIGLLGAVSGTIVSIIYIHLTEAIEYIKTHDVSFKIAWQNTKTDIADISLF